MSKVTSPKNEVSNSANVEVIESSNVEQVEQVEQVAEIPEFLKPILAEREREDKTNAETLDMLKAELKAAKKLNAQINAEFDYEVNEQTLEAESKVKAANQALNDLTKKLEQLKSERELSDLTNIAKYDLADKLGISLDKISELIESSKQPNNTLKSSFIAVFGKPTLFIKSGVTGKDLSKVKSSNGEVKQSSNGELSKAAQAEADLQTMTHDELLQKYPTYDKESNTYDYTTLNGTVRTAINRLKVKKQADGTYAPRA